MNLYKSFFKRAIDVTASGLGLLVLSPILGGVTLWLSIANRPKKSPLLTPPLSGREPDREWATGLGSQKSPLLGGDLEGEKRVRWLGSPFFLQERPGKNSKIFKVVKFKTMTDERDADGKLLPDEKRLTKVGRFVRSTSIDELPQLWNVFKGDMSLIGPRPLLPQYLPLYSPKQARRHEVRPGITGWAQVHGRNHCKLSKKFELDVWYVDNVSLKNDIKIILQTIKNVVKREDIGEGAGDMKDIDDLGFMEKLNSQK